MPNAPDWPHGAAATAEPVAPASDPARLAAQAAARGLALQAEAMEKTVRAAARALKALATAATWDDPAELLSSAQKIEKVDFGSADVRARLADLAATVKRQVGEEDRRLRMAFGREMREAATGAGLEFAPLTSDPPEYRLGPLTVVLDLPRRTASLRYARLELDKVGVRPAAIVEAARRHITILDTRDFRPERFFEQLLQAYQVRLHRIGQPLGTRIDLVDILGELAFAMQGPDFFEDPIREKFTPYKRVQLAWDLARLRRAGRLSHRGMRLSLGAATGGSTKQKSSVLYLEDERGSGQYYLSLRFTAEEPGVQTSAPGA